MPKRRGESEKAEYYIDDEARVSEKGFLDAQNPAYSLPDYGRHKIVKSTLGPTTPHREPDPMKVVICIRDIRNQYTLARCHLFEIARNDRGKLEALRKFGKIKLSGEAFYFDKRMCTAYTKLDPGLGQEAYNDEEEAINQKVLVDEGLIKIEDKCQSLLQGLQQFFTDTIIKPLTKRMCNEGEVQYQKLHEEFDKIHEKVEMAWKLIQIEHESARKRAKSG